MANLNLSKRKISDIFENFATKHKMVNRYDYTVNELWEVDRQPIKEGVIMWVRSDISAINDIVVQWKYDVFFFDYVDNVGTDRDNSLDVESDTAAIAQDFLLYLRDQEDFESIFNWVKTLTITPFRERFSDLYAGNFMTLELRVPYSTTFCDLPL